MNFYESTESKKEQSKMAANFISNGELEIIKVTKQYYEEAVELFKENFIKNENLALATGLGENSDAVTELLQLFRGIMEQNISFAAKDTTNQRLAGICMNIVMNPSKGYTLDAYFSNFKSPQMVCIGECLDRMENTFDIYDKWNIDCALEIVFLCTSSKYERKGIGRSLTHHTVEVARKMSEDHSIHDYLRPKAVSTVLTSIFSQKIGAKLNFEIINQVSYEEFSFNGRSFAEKIPSTSKVLVFAAMRLK